MGTLRLQRQGSLALIRLGKPRGNAINEPLLDDLGRLTAELDQDDSVRGVLLASANPKIFCPGLDLVALLDYDRQGMRRFVAKLSAMWSGLYGLRKPLVAAIHGHAVAGGFLIALTADHRVMERGAQIGLNELRVGLPLPWTAALLLEATLPRASLSSVALLGRNFGDEEAVRHGLAHEVAERGELEPLALMRLEEYAHKEPAAFATTKTFMRADVLRRMQAEEGSHCDEIADMWLSESSRERIRAAVERLRKRVAATT